MDRLIAGCPYDERDDNVFLSEMNELTRHHMEGCEKYRRIFPGWKDAVRIEDIPFLHVGLFKIAELKTAKNGIRHGRVLHSSSTGGSPSRIALDDESLKLQSESVKKILVDFMGKKRRSLVILDSAEALRGKGVLSARVAAAMGLSPLASEIHFLLTDGGDPKSIRYDFLAEFLREHDDFLVYGLSWLLWLVWLQAKALSDIASAIKGKRITFVHSGGWKKLEDIKVDSGVMREELLTDLHPASKIVDYYGLVEQVGVIFPLCEHGSRHVPAWADVIIRDVHTNMPLNSETGQLQFLNTISYGAPYHSVLTEDLGRLLQGPCPCGRRGKIFEMKGRISNAELRGCSNV